jgi:transposase InsO family protein
MECEPGEEAQVDYGTVWTRIGGRKRKIHVLRVTLSHSRKGYTEAMPRQDTESFVRGIENALRHFGGVPQLLVLDNLKAGVLKADCYDPQLNPKFESFCRHYGMSALPTRPRTPQHKGKVESNIRYVRESAVRGKEFAALGGLNAHLREWERTVADRRIHGTTRKQVGAHFQEVEKPALLALPPDLFASFVEARRRVHRDSHVEFEKAYYDVPPEYIGRELWVRGDGRLVHLFNLRMEQVAVHAKLEAGCFSKALGCGGAATSVRESLRLWTRRVAEIGPEAGLWAKVLVDRREATALRVLMGLFHQLLPRHGKEALERACAQARQHGQYRLRDLKDWLERPGQQEAFSFLSEHEVIRDLGEYGRIAGFEENN